MLEWNCFVTPLLIPDTSSLHGLIVDKYSSHHQEFSCVRLHGESTQSLILLFNTTGIIVNNSENEFKCLVYLNGEEKEFVLESKSTSLALEGVRLSLKQGLYDAFICLEKIENSLTIES